MKMESMLARASKAQSPASHMQVPLPGTTPGMQCIHCASVIYLGGLISSNVSGGKRQVTSHLVGFAHGFVHILWVESILGNPQQASLLGYKHKHTFQRKKCLARFPVIAAVAELLTGPREGTAFL